MMSHIPDDLADLEGALVNFGPTEPEDLYDILSDLNSGENEFLANGLKSISSQSLSDIASTDTQPPQRHNLYERAKQVDNTRQNNGDPPAECDTPQPSQPIDRSTTSATGGSQQSTNQRSDVETKASNKKCSICQQPDQGHNVYMYRNLMMCINCKSFFKRAFEEDRKVNCKKNNNCQVVYVPSKKICGSCRMKKAISLGLIGAKHPENSESSRKVQTPDPPAPVDSINISAVEINDPERAMEIALYESLINYANPGDEDRWEPYNPEDIERAPLTFRAQYDVLEKRKGPPKVVFTSACGWSATDLIDLSSVERKIKSKSDGVKPRGPDLIIRYSNDIDDDGISLVTKNLDFGKVQPIEEISIPVISLNPSVDLIKAEERETLRLRGIEPPMRAGDAVRGKSKPKLCITLNVRRTTIDRRPMLKRLKTSNRTQLSSDNSSGVTSSSLIGPGEDCDDSDDEDEVVEIDCDT